MKNFKEFYNKINESDIGIVEPGLDNGDERDSYHFNNDNEIIIHEVNGLIVPSKNIDALYEAMKKMVEDTFAREKMAANARPLIASRFEKSFVQGCLIEFYNEILNKN